MTSYIKGNTQTIHSIHNETMRLKLKALAFLGCFLFQASSIFAQIQAQFSASPISGCSPLKVQFTDQSTGPVVFRSWDFGNGNTAINQTAPIATYTIPGKYTVKLLVKNAAGDSSVLVKTQYIRVFANPLADFTATPVSGCKPLQVGFTDLSTPSADGAISQWSWDYGDGTNGNTKNPNHLYTLGGNFPVSLIITDVNGCTNKKLISNYIKVSNPPIINFASSGLTQSCTPPLNVQFTNTSTSPDGLPLSYLWKFGDGTTSTSATPSHIYTQKGNYSVTLVVTDGIGCKDSVVLPNFIQIASMLAKFSTLSTTVCPNTSVQFSNNSSGAVSYSWDFGDGGKSTNTNPSHVFTTGGVYPVKLVATAATTCQDSSIVNITVENLQANFSTDIKKACTNPFTVHYTDLSVGAVSWEYHFGDGTTSTQQNPTHIYKNAQAKPVVNYFTEYLIVKSANGCKDTVVFFNNIQQTLLLAKFEADTNKGCSPLTVNFTDLSAWHDSISSWHYDFGDGTSDNNPNPTHIFTIGSLDAYKVKMTITNADGCTFVDSMTIKVGTKQNAEFSVDKKIVCGSDTVSFKDLSTVNSKIDEWTWSFGDQSGGSKNRPPDIKGDIKHAYKDTGYMNVILIVAYHGCKDTIIKDSLIYVNAPISDFTDTMECANPKMIGFNTTKFIGVDRFYWNFGDGSPLDSIHQNPQHQYLASGDYFVKLTTYNNITGCKYETIKKIEVRVIKAAFTPSPVFGCAPLNVLFNSSASKNAVGYQWSFGDGVTLGITPNPFHIYNRGSYKAMLVVFDKNGCSDTAYKNINAYQPIAGFKLDTLKACAPGTINISDTSKINGTPIVSYSWKFGDGGTSNVANPGKHTYLLAGTYKIRLYIVDQAGCTDSSVSQVITIIKPFANFSVSDQAICKGDSVQFFDFSSGLSTLTYAWNFGDGFTSPLANPYHTYHAAGSFQVSLKITDTGGCNDTKTVSNYISVHDKPQAIFSVDKQNGCTLPGIFTNSSIVPASGVTYLWTFGDGGASQTDNPVHQYIVPGKYNVQLIATDTVNGCADTTLKSAYITIYSSSLNLSSTPSNICKGESIHFQISNVINAIPTFWDFGDGFSLVDSVSMDVNHVYNNINAGGAITAYLYYIDTTLDATCKNFQTTVFNVRDVIARFNVSGKAGCMPFAVNFTDQSNNPNTWNWDFGDGSTSNVNNPPSHSFVHPGIYTVTLAISNNIWGCKDTIKDQVEVYKLPEPKAINNGPVCFEDSVQILASGGKTYLWSPITDFTYVDASTKPDPFVTLKTNTSYTVLVTDSNGCVNYTQTDVKVIMPASSNLISDSTVIIGSKVILDSHASSGGYTYSWTPTDHLSCSDCPNPVAEVLDSITYVLLISDTNGCFERRDTIRLRIIKAYAIDLPQVFTPNGDGNNDIVYATGWGIKKLLEFKIFNRWGEMVFESQDMKDGWDGYYKGTLQNNETYVYIVRGESFKGDIISKKGNITLLK